MTRFVRAAMAVAALGLVFSASEAQAQVSFSIAGGPSFALGDAGDGLDMGYHAKVGIGFKLPVLPIGLEADGMWTRFDITDTEENTRLLSGTLNAVINLPTPGITPYIIGGVGFYNEKLSIDDADSESEMGVNIGAGLRLGLPGLNVFAEARLHNIFTEGESTRFVPLSLGIRF